MLPDFTNLDKLDLALWLSYLNDQMASIEDVTKYFEKAVNEVGTALDLLETVQLIINKQLCGTKIPSHRYYLRNSRHRYH